METKKIQKIQKINLDLVTAPKNFYVKIKKTSDIKKVLQIDFESRKILVRIETDNPCDNGYIAYEFGEVILVFLLDKTKLKK
jgi:hypothetical protein